jgi:hypothetical protein
VASVGLLYVGAVLFINGIMLLGWLDAKSAALFPVLGRRRPGPATPSPSPDRSATPATG